MLTPGEQAHWKKDLMLGQVDGCEDEDAQCLDDIHQLNRHELSNSSNKIMMDTGNLSTVVIRLQKSWTCPCVTGDNISDSIASRQETCSLLSTIQDYAAAVRV